MRISSFLSLATVLLPAGLAAQGFEGTVTMRAGISAGEPVETRMWIKGGRARIEFTSPAGPMAFLLDQHAAVTRVMDGQKRYMIMPGGTAHPVKYTATGKHDTVAGYACDFYKLEGGKERGEQACVTTALGFVAFGPGGPVAGADQADLRARFPSGFFVLKTITGDGSTRAEVIKVEKGAVSESKLSVPAGYTEIHMPDLRPPKPTP